MELNWITTILFFKMSKLETENNTHKELKEYFDEYIDIFLNSRTNTYVVFDGAFEVKFEGDLIHCCAWLNSYGYPYTDSAYKIYSKEAYTDFMNDINEAIEKSKEKNEQRKDNTDN